MMHRSRALKHDIDEYITAAVHEGDAEKVFSGYLWSLLAVPPKVFLDILVLPMDFVEEKTKGGRK